MVKSKAVRCPGPVAAQNPKLSPLCPHAWQWVSGVSEMLCWLLLYVPYTCSVFFIVWNLKCSVRPVGSETWLLGCFLDFSEHCKVWRWDVEDCCQSSEEMVCSAMNCLSHCRTLKYFGNGLIILSRLMCSNSCLSNTIAYVFPFWHSVNTHAWMLLPKAWFHIGLHTSWWSLHDLFLFFFPSWIDFVR